MCNRNQTWKSIGACWHWNPSHKYYFPNQSESIGWHWNPFPQILLSNNSWNPFSQILFQCSHNHRDASSPIKFKTLFVLNLYMYGEKWFFITADNTLIRLNFKC